MNITGITGGSAENVIAAGIIHGNVTVGSDEYLRNLEGQTLDNIGIWTQGLVRVSAVDTVIQKLREGNNWVTITGNAGEGKTSLGYMVLKNLSKEGRKVFKIDTPEDYTHVVRKWKNSVIMLNDIFGAFAFDSSALNKWQSLIQSVLNEHEKSREHNNKTQVLFVSRRNVLEGARDHLGGCSEAVLDSPRVLDLSQIKVTDERLEILNYFLSENNLVVDDSVKQRIVSGKTPHGFPHCCKIFTRLAKKGEEIDIEKFFASPLQFLDQTTKVLMQNSKHMALFKALIVNHGKLDISSITDDERRCDIQTSAFELMGSYLKKSSGLILFSHPSIYESVISVICDRDQVFFAQSASLSVLMQKLNIKQNDQDIVPGCINADPLPKVIDILTERFRPQVLEKDFSVFGNLRLCGNIAFCQALVKSCTRRSWLSLDMFKTKQTLYIDDVDRIGRTMLIKAEESENYTAVRVLLEHGADVNKKEGPRFGRGKSTFHIACSKNIVNPDHIQLLLEHGVDVNKAVCYKEPYMLFDCYAVALPTYPTTEEETALHYLCLNSHPDVRAIELLMQHGADANRATSKGETALHYLCKNAQSDIRAIEVLVQHGADVNKADGNGDAVLHYQFRRNKPDVTVTESLLKLGADVNKADGDGHAPLLRSDATDFSFIELLIKHGGDLNKTDGSGDTMVNYLCKRYDTDFHTIEFLIKHGADVNRASDDGDAALHCLCKVDDPDENTIRRLVKLGADVNKAGRKGTTALHCLCRHGPPNVRAITLLIEEGADVNKADDYGVLPLHCLCSQSQADVPAIALLIQHGADVNKADDEGLEPLHYLCTSAQPDDKALKLLIKHGADVNKADSGGATPFYCICRSNQIRAIEFLIMNGADVKHPGRYGGTTLHIQCSREKPDVGIVELLIKHGADVNKVDDDGMTVLHNLSMRKQGDIRIFELLIRAGADVKKISGYGQTALHYQCRREDPDISTVELLIRNGADVNKANEDGQTALHYLCRRDHPNVKMIELLIRHGADVKIPDDTGKSTLDYLRERNETVYKSVLSVSGVKTSDDLT